MVVPSTKQPGPTEHRFGPVEQTTGEVESYPLVVERETLPDGRRIIFFSRGEP